MYVGIINTVSGAVFPAGAAIPVLPWGALAVVVVVAPVHAVTTIQCVPRVAAGAGLI